MGVPNSQLTTIFSAKYQLTTIFFLPRYRFCRHPLPRPAMLPFSQTYLKRISKAS